MFKKLVVIDPVRLDKATESELLQYTHELCIYRDIPGDHSEIVRRLGDADGVLVSYATTIDRAAIEACPNIRYIGMCCSLYSPESANVDIKAANERGITVLGIRDYGDEGVLEYAVSELVRLLHGFGPRQWREDPTEFTGLKVGILGLGTTGLLLAKGLKFFGADIHYYSRTRKPEAEARGMVYLPFDELLQTSEILCSCLNKNTILLHEREFALFGNGKILLNVSLSPSYSVPAIKSWLANPNNYYLCDTAMALGDADGSLIKMPNVSCLLKSAGESIQSRQRLCIKVLENIQTFLLGSAKSQDSDP